jgi:hypothetical protein
VAGVLILMPLQCFQILGIEEHHFTLMADLEAKIKVRVLGTSFGNPDLLIEAATQCTKTLTTFLSR